MARTKKLPKVPRGRADGNTEDGVNRRLEKVLTDEPKRGTEEGVDEGTEGRELSHPKQEAQNDALTDDDERDW